MKIQMKKVISEYMCINITESLYIIQVKLRLVSLLVYSFYIFHHYLYQGTCTMKQLVAKMLLDEVLVKWLLDSLSMGPTKVQSTRKKVSFN